MQDSYCCLPVLVKPTAKKTDNLSLSVLNEGLLGARVEPGSHVAQSGRKLAVEPKMTLNV